MAKQTINIGTTPNDNTGDPLRTAFSKVNANFTEVYELVNAISVGDILSAVNRASAISASLTSVDNKLSGAVDVLSAAVVSVNNRISTVSSQVAAALNAASAVSVNLVSVDGRLTSVDNKLSNAISALSAELTSVKNAISNTVSITSTDLTSAKNNLQSAINVVSNALSNEISNRNSAINVVSNALSALSVRADTMSNRISDEISNRRSASADLESHINTVSNAVSVVSAQLQTLSTNFTSTNAQLSNAWSAINRLSNVVSGLGGTNLDVISQSLSVISAAFVSQADRVSAISAQMFSINTVVSNLTSNVLSIDTKLSNAVSVVSAAAVSIESHVNTVSNAVSVVSAAAASVESHVNTVSNAVSVVSAAQLSTWNRVSAILTSSQTFSGTDYTYSGNIVFSHGNVGLAYKSGNVTQSYYDYDSSGNITSADALTISQIASGTQSLFPYSWLLPSWTNNGTNVNYSGLFMAPGNSTDALKVSIGTALSDLGDTIYIGSVNRSTGVAVQGLSISGGNISLVGSTSWNGNIIPAANLAYNLGNSTNYFSTVYAQNFTGNLSLGSGVVTGNLIPSANITYTLGNSTTRWLTVFANSFSGTATTAQYADLAEKYLADQDYIVGTVMVIGGTAEITQSQTSHDNSVLGVISGKPAYLMNSESSGLNVALTGRVPCMVKGPVRKGDVLVTSNIPGRAETLDPDRFTPGCILGKALEGTENDLDTIEIVVGIH